MRFAPARRFRQVGSTSVTFRVELSGRLAAFKPRTRMHGRGYLAELAAFRLALILGMDNVPPVVARVMARTTIRDRLDSRDRSDWEAHRREVLWDEPGVARGVMIHWVPDLTRAPFDRVTSFDELVRPALAAEAPSRATSELLPTVLSDLSSMVAFDFLIGNWDRFSGGNISLNGAGDRVYVRDHNAAFQMSSTSPLNARLRARLETVERFSREFVERVVVLDEASIRSALAPAGPTDYENLLSDSQIANVLVRRRTLLSYIGALIALYGEERVLCWP